jgi:hypothetical protein
MAMPVASMLKHFREEFEQHMEQSRDRADREAFGAAELGAIEEAGAA